MNLQQVYKNSLAHNIISNDVLHNRLHHAYMLVSPDKFKIERYATLVACDIFCVGKTPPCFNCLECQKIKNNNHGDTLFYPEKERLTVDESRKIAADIFLAPFESQRKVYIIKNFDNATIQAQNALLKTLEEPSKFVVFVLLVSNQDNVAITIKSRVKTIEEPPLSDEEIAQLLKGKKTSLDTQIGEMSEGNLTLAHEILANKEISNIIKLASDVFFKMSKSSQVAYYTDKFVKLKNHTNAILHQMMMVLNRFSIYLMNPAAVAEGELKQAFKGAETDYSIKIMEAIAGRITDAFKKLASNCGLVAVVDGLLMGILEEKYLGKK